MVMVQPLPPILKATRDLDPVDVALLLKIAAVLPGLRGSGKTVELRPVRHTGWRLSILIRTDTDFTCQ